MWKHLRKAIVRRVKGLWTLATVCLQTEGRSERWFGFAVGLQLVGCCRISRRPSDGTGHSAGVKRSYPLQDGSSNHWTS